MGDSDAERQPTLRPAEDVSAVGAGDRGPELSLVTIASGERPLVDSLTEGVVIADRAGTILFTNPALDRLLGWDAGVLVGMATTTLVPDRLRATHQDALARVAEANTSATTGRSTRMPALRADGSELTVELTASMIRNHEGTDLVVGVVRDVTGEIDHERFRTISDELVAVLAGGGWGADVINAILAVFGRGLDWDVGTLWRWRSDTEVLHCQGVWRATDDRFGRFAAACNGAQLRRGEGLPGQVMARNETVWLTDLGIAHDVRRSGVAVADGLQSAFAFPVRTGDRFVGVIELFASEQRPTDAPLCWAVAGVGARLGDLLVRLDLEAEQERLVAELEHTRQRQAFLLQANQVLAGARDFPETIRRLATIAVPMLGDICLIDVDDSSGSLARVAARHADPTRQALVDELRRHPPDPHSDHPAAVAVRTGRSQWSTVMAPEVVREMTHGGRHYELTRLLGYSSFMTVPLASDGRVLGALTLVATMGSRKRFSATQLGLAEELAKHVATVVDRARTYEEQYQIAHTLQRSLLPEQLEPISGVVVAARYRASSHAAEVGGDFYDFVPLDDGSVALVVGDVEGHDMAAAAVMGQLRSALRAFLQMTPRPGEVLSMLDEYLCKGAANRLATVCVAVLDVDTGHMAVASAGHPPPVVAHGWTGAVTVSVQPGPPLGVGTITNDNRGARIGRPFNGGEQRYPVSRSLLDLDGTAVLYTDGLVEDRGGDIVGGLERLCSVVATHPAGVDDLCDAVIEARLARSLVEDDIAVLAVRRQ